MRRGVVCLVLILTLAGCGSGQEGNPDVYDRIARLDDCDALQREFDIADDNNNTDYMKAADERMQEIGCYG